MSIQVVLVADVKDLGSEGDIVAVSSGYARNYLFPRDLAALVTPETQKRVEKIKRFWLLDTQLSAEDDELTPTMKLKRRLVEKKYAQRSDAMYR